MEVLRGTHGTLVQNRESIERLGFRPNHGRIGRGVYFWEKGQYDKPLAMAWVSQKYGSNNTGVVFFCKFNIENKDVMLDKDDSTFKEKLLLVAQYAGLNMYKESDISAAHDRLIREYEKDSKQPVKIIIGGVPSPKDEYFEDEKMRYPVRLLNFPKCYAVRDSSIMEVEEISQPFNTKGSANGL